MVTSCSKNHMSGKALRDNICWLAEEDKLGTKTLAVPDIPLGTQHTTAT